MRRKNRSKGRTLAVVSAAGLALGMLGAPAFAQSSGEGYGWHHDDSIIENVNHADANVDQASQVDTNGRAKASSGDNWSVSAILGINRTGQWCETDVSGGDATESSGSTLGNSGGDCTNDAMADNIGNSSSDISTGSASATNDASTSVSQDNSGGASASLDSSGSSINGGDGDSVISNVNGATLGVSQTSQVRTDDGAWANSGGNVSVSGVLGVNLTHQDAYASVSGGNAGASSGITSGNVGGNASNTSASSNTGTSSSSISTGNASASNSSSTTVSQSNSGSASSTSNSSNSSING